MAKKLSLNIAPTFKAIVLIPVPGGADSEVEFTFKHREKPEFKKFVESLADREDLEIVLDCTSAWDLDDAFDSATVEKMLNRFLGAGRAILNKYIEESVGARVKN